MGYETEAWRKPTLAEGDREIYSEHGRIANNVDFRSHWLVLVKAEYGGYFILVKHGGGEERISVGYDHKAKSLLALESLDSDTRYLILYVIYDTQRDAASKAAAVVRSKYQIAFLEGRLKRRKRDNQFSCIIVEPTPVRA